MAGCCGGKCHEEKPRLGKSVQSLDDPFGAMQAGRDGNEVVFSTDDGAFKMVVTAIVLHQNPNDEDYEFYDLFGHTDDRTAFGTIAEAATKIYLRVIKFNSITGKAEDVEIIQVMG